MLVKHLIELLQTMDPNGEVVGQYHDSSGVWPMGWVEVNKVPGDNRLVQVKVVVPEDND